MNKPDAVLRELGQLYDFYRELKKFKVKPKRQARRRRATSHESRVACRRLALRSP